VMFSALEHIEAADGLRIGCTPPGPGAVPQPRFPSAIGEQLFPSLTAAEREAAVEGLIGGAAAAQNAQGSAFLPVRAHLFFRNFQGLWVCTNPNCNAAPARTSPCPVGRLHYTPVLTCQCGSRVVELLYCEACGEVFLGGFRNPGVNPNDVLAGARRCAAGESAVESKVSPAAMAASIFCPCGGACCCWRKCSSCSRLLVFGPADA
jgi:DEAD/DEAH box helicase domain-containing protein